MNGVLLQSPAVLALLMFTLLPVAVLGAPPGPSHAECRLKPERQCTGTEGCEWCIMPDGSTHPRGQCVITGLCEELHQTCNEAQGPSTFHCLNLLGFNEYLWCTNQYEGLMACPPGTGCYETGSHTLSPCIFAPPYGAGATITLLDGDEVTDGVADFRVTFPTAIQGSESVCFFFDQHTSEPRMCTDLPGLVHIIIDDLTEGRHTVSAVFTSSVGQRHTVSLNFAVQQPGFVITRVETPSQLIAASTYVLRITTKGLPVASATLDAASAHLGTLSQWIFCSVDDDCDLFLELAVTMATSTLQEGIQSVAIVLQATSGRTRTVEFMATVLHHSLIALQSSMGVLTIRPLPDIAPAASAQVVAITTSPPAIVTGEQVVYTIQLSGVVDTRIDTLLVAFTGSSGLLEVPLASVWNSRRDVPGGLIEVDVPITLPYNVIAEPAMGKIVFGLQDSQGRVASYVNGDLRLEQAGVGVLHMRLTWDTYCDVDLHVFDPLGGHVFFANMEENGGILDRDSNPACSLDYVNTENIVYEIIPAVGDYEVRVHMYNICGQEEANYHLTVTGCGVDLSVSGALFNTNEFDSYHVNVDCSPFASVSGVITYEHVGFRNEITTRAAAEGLRVEVRRLADQVVVAQGKVGLGGRYEISFIFTEGSSPHAVFLVGQSDGVNVRRVSDATPYAVQLGSQFLPTDGVVVRNFFISNHAQSGWVNIASLITRAHAWYAAQSFSLERTDTWWEVGVSEGSYMDGSGGIHILGVAIDPDEFDDSVILHEYGHVFTWQLGPQQLGGVHFLDKQYTPPLAYSEGLASFLGQTMLGNPMYQDRNINGGFEYNIHTNFVPGTSNGLSTGNLNEVLVSSFYWESGTVLTRAFLTYHVGELNQLDNMVWGRPLYADLADVVHEFGCTNDAIENTLKTKYQLNWIDESGFC